MAGLFNRIRKGGFVVLLGLVLIIYVAFGILYLQQGPKQREFAAQIARLEIVTNKPLPSIDKLRAEYKSVTDTLTIMPLSEIFDRIVGAAQDSGIDIAPAASRFSIPPPGRTTKVKVGSSQYQVLPFKGIVVQGTTSQVLDFVNRMDSGAVLSTLVVRRVAIQTAGGDTSALLDVDYYSLLPPEAAKTK